MPAGPSITTSRPLPASAPATRSSSAASSASRSRREAEASGGKDGAGTVERGTRGGDQLLGLTAQGIEVVRRGVVELVGRELEHRLQADVAVAHHGLRLEFDRVRDAVEDHVEHGAGPAELAPPARLLERVRVRVGTGA